MVHTTAKAARIGNLEAKGACSKIAAELVS